MDDKFIFKSGFFTKNGEEFIKVIQIYEYNNRIKEDVSFYPINNFIIDFTNEKDSYINIEFAGYKNRIHLKPEQANEFLKAVGMQYKDPENKIMYDVKMEYKNNKIIDLDIENIKKGNKNEISW